MKVVVETSKRHFDQKHKTLNLFFEQILGWNLEIVEMANPGFKINFPSGSTIETPSNYFDSNDLGIDKSPRGPAIKVSTLSHELVSREKLHIFFGEPTMRVVGKKAVLGWDLFACIFFMAFRIEEINDTDPDEHGRSRLKNSLAYREGFYGYPLVNAFADLVKSIALGWEEDLPGPTRKFEVQPTLDIDHPFKYAGIKGSAKFLRDVLKGELRKRGNLDPYLDRTVQLITELNEIGYVPLVFFLLGPYGPNGGLDLSTRKKLNKEVLNSIAGLDYIPGIHIGYYDWENSREGIKKEKEILEEMLDEKVSASRYHYLRFRFPQMVGDLKHGGIDRDFSLGYSNEPGFRSGICHPYLLQDPAEGSGEVILETPLILMDRTMMNKRGDTRYEDLVRALLEETKRYDGTFSMLLHNSTFDEPGGMEVNELFLEICRQAKEED